MSYREGFSARPPKFCFCKILAGKRLGYSERKTSQIFAEQKFGWFLTKP
jgi:hypothetical protein